MRMRLLVALPLAAAAWTARPVSMASRRTIDLIASADGASPFLTGGVPPPPAPSRGEEDWGTWAQDSSTVTLEMNLDDNVSAERVCVEIVENFLLVGEDRDDGPPPLLFGRLLQSCAVDDLTWAIDNAADGRRMLCIELHKLEAVHPGTVGATADCIFDETLHICGKPCLVPGLSFGTITLQLPHGVEADEAKTAKAAAEAVVPAKPAAEDVATKTAEEEAAQQVTAPTGFEWGGTY